MIFDNIKKYLLVFSALLLVGGNIGFSSDYDSDDDQFDNRIYVLVGQVSEEILKNNIKTKEALIQYLNKENNNKYNKIKPIYDNNIELGEEKPENEVDYIQDFTIEGKEKPENEIEQLEDFSIKQQDQVRKDTVKKALQQAQAIFSTEDDE